MRPGRTSKRGGSYALTTPARAPAPSAESSGSEAWDQSISQEFEGCDATLLQQFDGNAPQSYPRKWGVAQPVVPMPVASSRVAVLEAARQAKTSIAAVQTTAATEGEDLDQAIAKIKAQSQGPKAKKVGNQKWMLDCQTRALVEGARKGQLSNVQTELAKGADPNCKDEKGYTPLIRAAGEGYVAVVEVLIKSGADVDTIGDYKSPLVEAVTHGHQDCARMLLEHGALVDLVVEPSKHTGLLAAAMHGQVECVKLMLEYRADLGAVDVKGRTALMLAGFMGSHASVRKLIESGAEIEACCQIGRTAFLWSCAAGTKGTDSVEEFLKAGCNVDVKDQEGGGWEGRTETRGGQLPQPICKQSRKVIEGWLERLKNSKAAQAEQELLAMLEKEEEADEKKTAAKKAKKSKGKKGKKGKKSLGKTETEEEMPAAAGVVASIFGGISPLQSSSPSATNQLSEQVTSAQMEPERERDEPELELEPEPEPEPETVLGRAPQPTLTPADYIDQAQAADNARSARTQQLAVGGVGNTQTGNRRKKKGGTTLHSSQDTDRVAVLERRIRELEQQNKEKQTSEQSNRATLQEAKKAKEAQEVQFSQQMDAVWQDVRTEQENNRKLKSELDNVKASLAQEQRRLVNATRDATHAAREAGALRQELQTMAVRHSSEVASIRGQLAKAQAAHEALRAAPPAWSSKMLAAQGYIPGSAEPTGGAAASSKTEKMLLQLHQLVNRWSSMLMPIEQGHSHLYTFGSYLLVGDEQNSRKSEKRRASDVDVLVVVPGAISRKHHFFGTNLQSQVTANAKDVASAAKQGVLAAILMRDERVKHVMAAPDAFVPCLRLEFMGVDVDLTFASLRLDALPPQNVSEPYWALRPPPQKFMIETSLPPRLAYIESYRSMNGVRTTHAILRAVPSMELFRTVLISVRRWAKARGVYGPTFGFPAGITWALLTAAVCQRMPAATPPATVLSNFFQLWSTWPFPAPVSIGSGDDEGQDPTRSAQPPRELDSEAWHPKISGGTMPVLTPCYPSIDACHLMPAAVFEVVRRELLEADLVRATQTAVGPWATSGRPLGHLWATQWCDKLAGDDAEQSFFTEYSHYIQLCVANEGPTSKKSAKKKATGGGAATYEPSQWAVLVQSQLRRLVRSLDIVRAEQRHVTALRPFPRSFPGSSSWMQGQVVYFIGVQLSPEIGFESPAAAEAKHETNGEDEEDAVALLKFGASTSPNPSPKGTSALPPTPDLDLGGSSATVSDDDLAAMHAAVTKAVEELQAAAISKATAGNWSQDWMQVKAQIVPRAEVQYK